MLLEKVLKTRWIEPLVITLLLPIIGYVIDASDPFFINYHFPWLIIAPLLTSLRYGFVWGITSAALLISMIACVIYLGGPQVSFFPEEMIIGLLLLTVISAEFYESWARKINMLDYKYTHLKVRMDKFARSYHLIKASHYQLEQHLASQAKSLRLSLLDLKEKVLTLEQHKGEPLAGIGENILKILGSYMNVQMAGIYAVNEQREIGPKPVASLGQPCTLFASDPVIEEALRTGHVASIETEKNGAMAVVGVLVAIPLVDVYHKIWGMIVVNEMPLFALQESTMDFLAVLGGKVGDLIKRRAESCCNDTDGKKVFESRLRRILGEIKNLKTSAVTIATIISSEELQRKFLAKFQAELRGGDEILIVKDSWDRQVFLMLLPHTDENGANEFLNRIELSKSSAETVCHGLNRMAFSFHEGNIRVCIWTLSNKTSREKVLLEIDEFYQN
ncbi:PelD GGDEF domain-containing protein [Nitrosovibrio tenuis]|uniref:PelD GGDEF domain-containing protein n=1 Tax=Nitrosovibrio tenuis TaxID=1233 RepID=A0A1H7GVV9_9PROT|nr:PelD GGDEF domain-containing protein [Nitrosovibrio tenuis]SEK42139.1 PelD GGDEF domain-containing protein [Nitrosovibrio tenuis]